VTCRPGAEPRAPRAITIGGRRPEDVRTVGQVSAQNDSAEALAAALAATEKALGEQRGRVAALEAARGEALLAGEAQARKHEAELREARDEAERLTALAEALRARHAEAERRERRERLERLAAEARAKAEAAGKAIAREYPRLAARLVELLQAERDTLAQIVATERELGEAGAEAEGIPPIPRPADFYMTPNGLGVREHLCRRIVLPRHDGSLPEHGSPDLWRAGDHVLIAGQRVI
jgi:hypothetical protein